MKIFELLNQAPNQQLDPDTQTQIDNWFQNGQQQNPEDDEQGKFDTSKVDQNLQDLAQGAADQNAQPEPPGGAPETAPELDDTNVKPVDDALIQQTKNEPYVIKWNVKDNSPIAPMKIMQMQLDELSHLQNMVRFQQQNISLKNKVGANDTDAMQWYNDLLRFVNTVADFKKSNTKAQLAKINPTPAYQTSARSK